MPRGTQEDFSQVEFDTSEDVEVTPSFASMGLREELLRGIYSYGFERPSAIQQRSIKPIIKGRDVIAQAQSGTGKTATFSIGVLQSLNMAVSILACRETLSVSSESSVLNLTLCCLPFSGGEGVFVGDGL